MTGPDPRGPTLTVEVRDRNESAIGASIPRKSLLPTKCYSSVGMATAKTFPKNLIAMQRDHVARTKAAKRKEKEKSSGGEGEDTRDQLALLVAGDAEGSVVRLGALTLDGYRAAGGVVRRGVGSYHAMATTSGPTRPGTAPAMGASTRPAHELFKEHLGQQTEAHRRGRHRKGGSSSFLVSSRPSLVKVVRPGATGKHLGPGKYDVRLSQVQLRDRSANMRITLQTGGHAAAEALTGQSSPPSPTSRSAPLWASQQRPTTSPAQMQTAQPASPTAHHTRSSSFLSPARDRTASRPSFSLFSRTAAAHLHVYDTTRSLALVSPRSARGQHHFDGCVDRETASRVADPRECTPAPGQYFAGGTQWDFNPLATVGGHERTDLHVLFAGTTMAPEERGPLRPRTAGGLTRHIGQYRPSSAMTQMRPDTAASDATRPLSPGASMRSGFLFGAEKARRVTRTPDRSRPGTAALDPMEHEFAVVVSGREVDTRIQLTETGVDATTHLSCTVDHDADDPTDVRPGHRHMVADAAGVAWQPTDSGRPDVYGDPPGIRAQPVRGSMGKYRVEYEGTPSGRPGVPPDAIGLAAMAALLPPELGLDLDPRDDAGGGRRGEASQGRPGSPSRRPTSARPVTTRVDTSPPRSPYRPGTSHGRAMSPSSSAAGASPRKSRRISGRWAESTREQAMRGQGRANAELGRMPMYKDVEKDVHAVGLDLAHADLSKPSSPQHRVSLLQRSSSRVTRDDFEEIGRLKETLEGIDRRL